MRAWPPSKTNAFAEHISLARLQCEGLGLPLRKYHDKLVYSWPHTLAILHFVATVCFATFAGAGLRP